MEIDFNDPSLVSAFDELPLWAAPFGLCLLEVVRMRTDLRLLDLGCGAGFPALELAGRLGPQSRVVGLDPWRGALARARGKAEQYRLAHVQFVEGSAEGMPFEDGSFDVVVSNNGLNNVGDQVRALGECHRVLRAGGQLVATMNLPATMATLYRPLEAILAEREGDSGVARLRDHIDSRRKPIAVTRATMIAAGFVVDRVI